MTPLVTFTQTLTYELTPQSHRLPPFLWTTFTIINKVHSIWRWYRRIDLYRNPENLAHLLAGHFVNLTIGDKLLIRIAAQCLLIATRILECSQQQIAVYRSGKRWIEALKGHYPKTYRNSWNQKHQNLLTSPSSSFQLSTSSQILWDRIKRIVRCTLVIFIHLFKLSMCLMDTIDAFSLNPQTYSEGINESLINMIKWLNCLVENKHELLNGISSNQEIIEKILKESSITYMQLHSSVIKTLEKTEATYLKAKKVSQFSNGILIDLGKRILNGSMIVIGLSQYRPLNRLAP